LPFGRPLRTDTLLAKRRRATYGGTRRWPRRMSLGLRMQPRNEKFFPFAGKARTPSSAPPFSRTSSRNASAGRSSPNGRPPSFTAAVAQIVRHPSEWPHATPPESPRSWPGWNGGALDDVRALPAKGKNFSCRGCTRRPMGHPPGPATCTPVRGAPPLRKKGVSSQRATKAKARKSHSLPLLTFSRLEGLRQDPGRAAESSAGPRTDEDMGARRACVVVDPWGRGDEPLVGLAVRLRALGAEVRVCAARLGGAAGRLVGGKATRDGDVPSTRFDRA